MTDQSQQKQRKRKQQIVIIYMMMLPLLLIAICCGAQVGILTSGITTFGDGIRPLENADYSPWDQFRFGPIREDAITQAVQDGNRAAGVFIVTPTVAPTGTGTATVPPTFTPTPTTTSTPTDADSGNAGNAPDGEDTTITDGDDGGNGTTGSEEENAASTDVAADVAATEISVLATDNAEAETTLTAIAEATDVPTEQPTSTAPPATATTALVTPQPVNTSVPGATSVPAQPTSTDVPNDPVQNDPDAPVAAFDASENLGTVTFTNRSSGDITSYAWNFGDGNTSSSVSPVHAYTTTGTFTAQLTVTGPGGSDTATVIITVLPPVTNPTTTLALLLLPSDLTPAEGDTVTYTLQVSNSSSETASNIALNLNFPTGLSAGSATVSSGGYGGSVWSIPTLGGGTSASLQIPVQVAAGTAGTALTTVATVSAVTPANTGDISVSSTLNVQAITSTDLEIDISASTLTPLEGAPLILTGRVTNNGAVTATGIQVNAALATGLTFVSSSGPGTYNSGVWTLPSLASGATVTIDLQVTVDPGTGGSTITQNANLASIDQTETDATNNNDTVLITVTAATADLSLVMIPPAGSVNRRDANDITFQVTNNSASPSSNVELTGTLPGGVSFVSSADCSAAGSNLTCTPVNLAAGATQTYTVTVRFNDLGQQVFTGSVTADTTDPNTANNTATLTADVMSIRACPDDGEPNIGAPNGVVCRVTSTLVLDMGGSAIVTQPGAYDFAYYESFSFGATDSVAVDLAVVSVGTSPTGPWFEVFNWGNDVIDLNSSIGQAGYGNGSEPANLVIPTSDPAFVGSLPYKTGIAIDVDAVAPAGTYQYVQFVIPGSVELDAVQPVNIPYSAPSLADVELVTFTVNDLNPTEGDTVEITIVVRNNGTSTATGVVVAAATGDPVGSIMGGAVASTTQGTYGPGDVWTVGTLAPSTTATLTFSSVNILPGSGGSTVTRSRTVSANEPDPDTSNNTNSYTLTVQPAGADLEFTTFSFDNTNPAVGDTVTATLVVTNNGPDTATGVILSASTGTGVLGVPQSITTSQGTLANAEWDIGTLNSGQSATATIEIRVGVVAAGTTVSRSREIEASDQPDPDSTPNNGVTTEDDYNSYTVVVQPLATDIAVGLSADTTNPYVGTNTTLTLQATNTSAQDASNIVISNPIPAELTYVSDTSGGSYNPATGEWTLPALTAGTSTSIEIVATVNGTNNSFDVTATLTGVDGTDTNSANDSATVSFTAIDVALQTRISVDNATPAEGDTITYTVRADNFGSGPATNIEINVPLPAGLTYVSHQTSGSWTYAPGTGVWTIPNLASGFIFDMTITATVDGGTAGTTITTTSTITAVDQPDQTTGDDTDSVDIAVAGGATDPVLNITVDNPTPSVGDNITFTVTLQNTGTTTLTNIQIDIALSNIPVSFQSDSPAGASNSGEFWVIPSLAAGATETLQITGRVADGAGGATWTQQVALDSLDQTIPDPASVFDQVDIVVPTIDLRLVSLCSSDPSTSRRWRVDNRNVMDIAFDWRIYNNSASGSGIAPADGNVQFTTPGGTNPYTVIVSVGGVDQDTTSSGGATCDVDLATTITVDNAIPTEGETIEYFITVANNDVHDASQIEVTGLVPAGLTLIGTAASQGVYNSGTWDVGSLPAGGTALLEITATVDAGTAGTTITSNASITNAFQPDANTANNTDSVDINVQ